MQAKLEHMIFGAMTGQRASSRMVRYSHTLDPLGSSTSVCHVTRKVPLVSTVVGAHA